MDISEVRIKLVDDPSERLRAFCSITLDGDFVIRDLKIIDGVSGPFVAMPSRKLADRCPRCGCKNHLRAKYCNDCGLKLNENRAPKDAAGRAKLHADVAHPINAMCRERIQTAVIKSYEIELERSKSPDYKPPVYDDFGDDDVTHLIEVHQTAPAAPAAVPVAEPKPVASGAGESEEDFSDYNSLIADLKREAATRHGRNDRSFAPQPVRSAAPPRGGREMLTGRPERQESDRPRPDRNDRRDERGRGDRSGPPRDRREPSRSRPQAAPEPDVQAAPPAGPVGSGPKSPEPARGEEDDFAAGL